MAEFFTKREVAERFRVTPRTVENWIARGMLAQPVKLGARQQSRVRFAADAVTDLERTLRNSGQSAATP